MTGDRRAMKTRLVNVFAVIGALAVLGGLLGLFLVWRMVSAGFGARTDPSGLEAWSALKLRKLAVPGRYKDMRSPVAVGDEARKGAMAHWADHCAVCHANDGSGRTTMGQNMYPRPPDMRAARTQKMSDGEIYYVINQGIRLTGMPAWGTPGDDDRASWELVAFIRKLPTLTPAEIESMKAMNPVPASVAKAKREEDDFLNDEQPKDHKGH